MPSRGYLWNLNHWVQRLGFNRTEVPEIAYSVQPVTILGDASALSSPLLPPLGMAGGNFTSGVGLFAVFAYQTGAPGGAFIRHSVVGGSNAQTWIYQINPTATDLATSTVLPITDMGPDPVQGQCRFGTLAAILGADNFTENAKFTVTTDFFYLRPGHELLVQSVDANEIIFGAIIVQDVPASIPAA